MGNAASTEYWGDQIPREEEYGPDHRLTIRAVKLFTDGMHIWLGLIIVTDADGGLGALGSWGAALLEPYSDRPDFSGIMRTSPETLEKVATRLWNDGFQVVCLYVCSTDEH
jgi:predicted amidohydrolase YtcJ